MADFGDMQLKITADIDDVLTKVEAARAKLNQLVESQQRLKDNISNLNFAIKANEKEIDGLTKKLQGLNTATKEGNAASVQLKSEINNLRKANLGYGQELVTTKKELVATTAQIKVQNGALKEAEKSTAGFGGGVTKLYSGLRTLANIIPGVGIGGLVALVGQGAVEAFNAFAGAVGNVAEAQKLLNTSLAGAAGSVAGEVAQLNSLASIARDTSLSYAARTQAIKELNKEYPQLHGNINLENINTAAVTETINKEIEAIKRRAQAKALEKLIDEESIKVEEARIERGEKVATQTERQASNFQKSLNKLAQGLGAPGLFAERSDAADNFNEKISQGTTRIEVYTKKLNELNTESAKAGTLFIEPDPDGKAAKKIETISDVLAKLEKQIKALNEEEIIFNVDLSKEKVSAIEGTIKSLLTKFQLTAANPVIIELEARVNDINLRKQFNDVLRGLPRGIAIVPFEIQFEQQQTKERLAKAVEEALNRFAPDIKPDPIVLGLDINPQINNDNFAAAFDEINKIAFLKSVGIKKAIQDGLKTSVEGLRFPELTKLANDARDKIETFAQAVDSSFKAFAVDSLSGIGESIGAAIGGDRDAFKGMFDSIFSSVGSQLQALGKFLILSGIKIEAAKKAFAKLLANPVAAIFVGIGLVALGALIKSQIGKSFSGFAEGGRVKGPGSKTSDSIPAMLSDNEYVIKARSVDKFGVKFFDQLNEGKLPKVFSQNTGKVIFQQYTPVIELGKSFEKITSHLSAKTDSAKTALIREINSSKIELLKYVTTYNNQRDKVNSFKELTRFVSSQSTKLNNQHHSVSDSVKLHRESSKFISDKRYFYKDTKPDKYVSVSNVSEALKEKEKITFSAAKNVFKDAFNSVKDYLIKESKSAVSLKVYKGDKVTEKSFAPVKSTLPYYKASNLSDHKTSDFKAFLDAKKVSDTNTRSFSFIASKLTEINANATNFKELVTQKNVPAKYFIKESYKELLSGSITKNISSFIKDSLKTKESSPALKNIPYTYKGAVPKSLFILPVKSEVFKYIDSNKLFGFVKLLSSKVLEDVHTTYAKIAQVQKEGGRNLQTDLFRFSKVSLNDKASDRSFVSKITSKDNNSISDSSSRDNTSTSFKSFIRSLSNNIKDRFNSDKTFKSELRDSRNVYSKDRLNIYSKDNVHSGENNTLKERFNQFVKTFSDKEVFSNKLTASIKDVSNVTDHVKDKILYNFKSLSSFAKKDTELIKSLNSAKEVYSAKDSKESLKNIVSDTFEKLNTKYFQSSEKVNGFSKELYKNLKVSDTLTAKYFINNSELKSILSAKAHFSKDSGFKEVYSLKNTGLKVFEKLTKYFTNHSKLNTSFQFKSLLNEKINDSFSKEVYQLKNIGLKIFSEKLSAKYFTKYFTDHFKSILSEKGVNNFFHTITAEKRFAKDSSFSKKVYSLKNDSTKVIYFDKLLETIKNAKVLNPGTSANSKIVTNTIADNKVSKYFLRNFNKSSSKDTLSAKSSNLSKEIYSLKNIGLKFFNNVEKLNNKYFSNSTDNNNSQLSTKITESGTKSFLQKLFSISEIFYDKNSDKNFTSLTKSIASTIKNADKKTSEKTTGKNNTDKTYDRNYLRSIFKDRLEHLEHSKEFSRLNFQPSTATKYNVSSFTTDKLIVSSLKSFGNVKEQTFSNKIVSTFSNFIEKISSNKLLKYASGGFIQGPGTKSSDSVLIRASKGEYVIKAAAVDKYGVGLFDRLNAGVIPTNIFNKIFSSHAHMKNINMGSTISKIYNNLPRFATGGLVGGSSSQPIISNLIAGGFKFKHTFSPIVLRGKDLMTQIDRSQLSRNNNS